LGQVLAPVQRRDAWVGDRNFCTTDSRFGIAGRRAFFAIRQHSQALDGKRVGRRRSRGRSATGQVFEQGAELRAAGGHALGARRITAGLDKPARAGDTEIHILTEIPAGDT
jgi:hypothetical protein